VILAFDWYLLPPLRALDGATVLLLVLFLVMSVIVAAGSPPRRAVARSKPREARGDLAEHGRLPCGRLAPAGRSRRTARSGVFGAVTEEVGTALRSCHGPDDPLRARRYGDVGRERRYDRTRMLRIGEPWAGLSADPA